MQSRLRYTGHPFLDVGVATLVVATGVSRPQDITKEQVAEFIESELLPIYINPTMSNYLGTVIFSNVNFANPGMNTRPQFDEKRRQRLSAWFQLALDADPNDRESLLTMIDSFRQGKRPDWLLPADVEAPDAGERCAFSGDLAVIRVSRIIVPMTGSEDALNFVPQGRPRLPLAGWVLLALLAMPMGTLNSGGQVLLSHTMDHSLMQKLAENALKQNRQAMQIEGIKKRPNYRFARTQILKTLLELNWKYRRVYPLTVYKFSSAAQSAKIDRFSLETRVMAFIIVAKNRYQNAWNTMVRRAWHLDANPDEDPELTSKGERVYERRNYFYEDLFDLPHNASTFLRRYLLRRRRAGNPTGKAKHDPRYGYSLLEEREVISWNLTELFMEMMMDISKERVVAIRSVADRLAEYIENHDQRVYGRLYRCRKSRDLRDLLLKVGNKVKAQNHEPVVFYDEFITAFFYEDKDDASILREDWFLARDLLMIRIIEQLSQDWVSENADLLEEVAEAEPIKD
jgi:CRISPR-associated protein Cst1